VTDGVPLTVAPEVDDKPVEGVQAYVPPTPAPEAVIERPQKLPVEEVVIEGLESTVTDDVTVHPPTT
jgi:hypothetical protein